MDDHRNATTSRTGAHLVDGLRVRQGDTAASAGSLLLVRLGRPATRAGLLLVVVLLSMVIGARTGGVGVDGLRHLFDGLGLLGPVLFAAVYALAATLLVPAAPFTVAAGLLFGPVLGSVTALLGATAGATGAFLLARVLGRQAVEQFGGPRVAALDEHLAAHGWLSLLLVRLVPLFPFNLVNVSAGITGIALRDYVVATAIGIVPGTVAYAAIGGTVQNPTSPGFVVAVIVFALVTVAAAAAARRVRGRSVGSTHLDRAGRRP